MTKKEIRIRTKALTAAALYQRFRDQQLARDFLRDLVVEIRQARRDRIAIPSLKEGCEHHEQDQIAIFRILWPARHRAHVDRFGILS